MINIKSLCLITVLANSSLFAQGIVPNQLINPVENAIKNSYELQNKQLEINKNKAQYSEVKGKQQPNIEAEALAGYLYSLGSVNVPTQHLNLINKDLFKDTKDLNLSAAFATVGVTASQVIYAGLQIKNSIKSLDEKNNAYELLLKAGEEEVAKDVLISFDQIMLLNEVEKLIDNSSKRLEKEQLKVQKAIELGLAIPFDREKIKLALLELESKQLEISSSRKLLYEKLQMLTHLPINELETVYYDLQPIQLLTDEFNLENKPELKALHHSTKAYEFLFQKEKGDALPKVFAFAKSNYASLFATRLRMDSELLNNLNLGINNLTLFPNIMVGVGAKWEIFNGHQHKYKLEQAKNDILISENKYKDAEQKLNLLLSKNKIDYETANKKLKVNEQQDKIAKSNMEIATKRFQVGLIDITDYLATENDYFKAKLGYYSQILDQRSKTYDILHTSGELLNRIKN